MIRTASCRSWARRRLLDHGELEDALDGGRAELEEQETSST
jgi:hypothetical protein